MFWNKCFFCSQIILYFCDNFLKCIIYMLKKLQYMGKQTVRKNFIYKTIYFFLLNPRVFVLLSVERSAF